MAQIAKVTDENFIEEVLHSDLPVLLDCWATWCGPCKALEPEIEALAEEQAGRLKVAKLDVDENPSIAELCGVSFMPTMVLFVDGVAQTSVVGYHVKDDIVAEIEPHLPTRTQSS
ncbi:MAG: thioredoxin [Actinomycetota bacterium]|nr:thioredoxin [Actinomycetota bacterium]